MGYDIQSNIYRLKFGVIQGFPALRKAVTVYVKKYDIFSRVWYRQSAAERHSPFALFRLADEWTTKPSPFSMQGHLSEFFRIMTAKHQKNRYR